MITLLWNLRESLPVAQIYENIRNVYIMMEGVKVFSKLAQMMQMHILHKKLSDHRYIISDGLMEPSTDVQKILGRCHLVRC